MVEFSIKQVATNIGTSTQYIYQQMPELIEKGYAYRNEKNKPFIYNNGLEYLRNKRIENFKVEKPTFESNFNNINENVNNSSVQEFVSLKNSENVVAIYKELLEEQRNETKYWKELYIEKDRALTEITSKFLLSPGTEEREAKQKKGFLNFFRR